jgi:hypothetical protein
VLLSIWHPEDEERKGRRDEGEHAEQKSFTGSLEDQTKLSTSIDTDSALSLSAA